MDRTSGRGDPRKGARGTHNDDMKGHTSRYVAPRSTAPSYPESRTGQGRRLDLRYSEQRIERTIRDGGTARRVPARGYAADHSVPTAEKSKKSRYGAFFTIIIFGGIVVCVTAFALVLTYLSKNAQARGDRTTNNPGQTPIIGITDHAREVKDICLVKAVDPETRTFTLYGILHGGTYYQTVANSTDMKDRNGNNLVFGEYKPGDVVDVSYYENDSILLSIRHNAQANTFYNQEGVIVDSDNSRITHGNTTYIYGQELVSLYKGAPFDAARITTSDRVNVRFYQNVCVYIEVTAASGVIDVRFNEYIRNGNIAIGTTIYNKLTESRKFNVSEGSQQVVIKGDNIENFIRTVTVTNGEDVVIDLAEVQFKQGIIYFTSNVDDVYLTINGVERSVTDPVQLEYGTYAIRATALGYQVYERTIELREPMMNLPLNLEPIPTPTPRPEREDTTRVTVTTSNVGGVDVYVDGLYVGRTQEGYNVTSYSLTFDCLVGERQFRLYKAGYEEHNSIQQINTGLASDDFVFTMHPAQITLPSLP